MPRKYAPEQAIELANRDRRIIELRRDNWQWIDIGAEVGLSASRCHQIFEKYRTDIPQSVAAAWREEELDLLGRGIRHLLAMALDRSVSERTRAECWKEIRQHSESRRKLLGIDAPQKRELEVIESSSWDARFEAEIAGLEAEARAIETARSDQ